MAKGSPGRPRPRTPEYNAKLAAGIELIKNGSTAKAAAQKVGVAVQILSQEYHKVTGLHLSNQPQYRTPEQQKKFDDAVAMLKEGFTYQQVKERMNLPFSDHSLRMEARRQGYYRGREGSKAIALVWDHLDPVTQRAWKLLKDGQWHNYHDIIEEARKEIPPGAAMRWLEARRIQYFVGRHGMKPDEVPPRKKNPNDSSKLVYNGQYGRAQQLIRGSDQIEIRKLGEALRGRESQREIRLRVENLSPVLREELEK